MQGSSWNGAEVDLSPREVLVATLAFKIGTNISLTQEDSVAQLNQLPDEDIFAVLKMVSLFNYWQQLTSGLEREPDRVSNGIPSSSPLNSVPYFHKANPT